LKYQNFKEKSLQNKINKSLLQSGALDLFDHKSHLDIAVSLVNIIGNIVKLIL